MEYSSAWESPEMAYEEASAMLAQDPEYFIGKIVKSCLPRANSTVKGQAGAAGQVHEVI